MSEYQYYEFQAIDRRLTDKQMGELRSYSSRAQITPNSFSNDYSFGGFKGNEDDWMEKYFDAHLYLANWGTHILHLRLPAGVVPLETAELYCAGTAASVREKSGHTIFTFASEQEGGGDWVEGDGELAPILPVRAELAQGDLRSLYIGWLLCVQEGELAADELEPPVPPGLTELSGGLSNLVEFLRVDPDLIAVAAQVSASSKSNPAIRDKMLSWLSSIAPAEKDLFLLGLLEGEAAPIAMELRARFNRSRVASEPSTEMRRRSVGELLAGREAHAEKRQFNEANAAARAKAQTERLAADARDKHLNSLVGQEAQLWAAVESLVTTTKPLAYDLALQHLIDLRELAVRQGTTADFARRMAGLRKTHARKTGWIARLSQIEVSSRPGPDWLTSGGLI